MSKLIIQNEEELLFEAEEFLDTTGQELLISECSGCGERLTSFGLLVCCNCLEIEAYEFEKLTKLAYEI